MDVVRQLLRSGASVDKQDEVRDSVVAKAPFDCYTSSWRDLRDHFMQMSNCLLCKI